MRPWHCSFAATGRAAQGERLFLPVGSDELLPECASFLDLWHRQSLSGQDRARLSDSYILLQVISTLSFNESFCGGVGASFLPCLTYMQGTDGTEQGRGGGW